MKKIFIALFVATNLIIAGTTGKVSGKAIDSRTQESLVGVNVILVGTVLGAATDFDGNFVILNVPPGRYNVRAQSVGYQPIVYSDISVSIDLTTRVNFELKESSVELDAVVVEAKTEVLKKDVTSSQATVSFDQINNLPVAELTDVIELQAGVSKDADGNFHIRGGRTTEIAYWVNGISITDAYDNSRGIQIDNNSVQELQVISGTFNAEYGNAMSGIVNTVTKEGGIDYHGNVLVYSGDHMSNFTEYFPHINDINPFANYNLQGSLSGPVPLTNNAIAFFVNGRYNYDDGYLFGERKYNPNGTQGDSVVVPMNWHRNLYGQGNFSYSPLQEVKINLEGLYSKEDFQDYNHEYRWNPNGNVNKFAESFNSTLTLTHMLSSATFYTIKGSYFNKDFNEYLYKNPYDSRYQHSDSLTTNYVSYAFRTKGTNLHRFYRQTNTYLGKVDFTSQVSQEHLVKIGTEVKIHQLDFDDYNLEPARSSDGSPIVPFKPSIPGEDQTNRVKYQNNPLEASSFIQDKVEFESVIINVGLRIDYFDANGKVLVDVTDPNIYAPLRTEMEPLSIKERGPYFYKDSKAKFQISPRFGIAYPITETGVVHFSYGHFLQIPSFQYLFQNGPYKVPNSGVFVNVYGNPDLEAQKTVMYEIGFRQEFFENYLIDVTGFYRDVRDWITAGSVIQTRNLVTYSIFTNKDYANVKGITLTLNKRFVNNFSFDLNYTYQLAEGSNSKPEDEFNAAKGSGEPSLFLIPMDWDQNHLLNANLSVGVDGWRGSLLARYGTGAPYSPTTTIYTRVIGSGLQKNSRRIPSQFSLDLKLDKSIQLMGLEINLFTRVFNLLDNRDALKVFGDSGDPEFTTEGQNVGYNASRPNTVEEYLRYPDHYSEPRNVQFGFEFSF
jgi:outer membrane receptor protein involved in Fe transport